MQKAVGTQKISPWIWVFFFMLITPAIFYVGSVRLSSYRVILLILFIPLVMQWLSGKYGKIILPDVLIILYCFWYSIAYIYNHSFGIVWELIGSHTIETLGPYLLARIYIRNPAQFRQFVRILFIIILILLAVGVVETFTGRLLINDVVGLVAKTYAWAAYPPRLGFFRVQTTFEHPILFGVFCSSGFALFYYTKIGKSKYTSGASGASISGFATFLSLSMGAYISVAAQVGFIIWDKTTRKIKNSWVKLASGLAALYVLIDLLSNRSPIEVIIGHIAFNSHTSYFRVHIWNFGLENIKSNPVFGLGLHEWIRPAWMPSSIDNFWLLTAMTSGIPSFLFLVFAFLIIIRRIYKLKLSDTWLSNYRKGILFSIIGIFLSLCTVHVWNATFCYLMFLVGSSVWLIDYAQKQNHPSQPDQNNMEESSQGARPS